MEEFEKIYRECFPNIAEKEIKKTFDFIDDYNKIVQIYGEQEYNKIIEEKFNRKKQEIILKKLKNGK